MGAINRYENDRGEVPGWMIKQTARYFFLFTFFTSFIEAGAQSLCGPTTPTYTVDLTGQPNGIYFSPYVVRADTCCGSTSPDRCIQFIVTLDPAATGLIFNVCDGAVPPGALYYQVNCGLPQAVGTGICMNPPYPDTITFCKPGSNQNQYCIQSISPPSSVGLSKNCTALMWTYGFEDSTITWTSIFPGPAGSYNGYLSCTSGCDSTWVTPQTGYPPYIDYKVCGTVTNGCNKTFCDTVRVNFPPPLTISSSYTNALCYGENSGTATVNVGGGIPPYTYSWSPAGGSNATSLGLYAGIYTCAVADVAGCTIISNVVITQPPQLIGTFSSTFATCSQANGSASVSMSGGTGAYTYQWLIGQTTATTTGLGPGVYPVTIGDANGCTASGSVPVSNVLPIVTVNSNSVTCFGGFDGNATSNASGGVPPYGYQWSNGQTSSTATGLSAGSYTVATSSFGCIHYDIISIAEPTPLLGMVSALTNVSCKGGTNGTAAVSYSGGTPGYTFQWSNGQISNMATGLAAGNYTVTVTDALSCTDTKTLVITEPLPLTVLDSDQVNVLCHGANTGSASITVSGGTPIYTYQWNSGHNLATATGLTAGNYTCTVVDANGCTLETEYALTEPPPLSVTATGDPNSCAWYNVNLSGTAQGGVPGYSYSWNPGAASSIALVVTPSASTVYTLNVTDANGCTQSGNHAVTIYPQPFASFSAANSCLNNAMMFNDQSTSGATMWSWNFGEPASGSNNISTIQNPSHNYGVVGTYSVALIISNSYGCADTLEKIVAVNPLPSVSFTSNTVCQGNTTTFSNSSFIPGGNISTWSWNFGDPNSGANNISASQDPTHIFTSAGNFNVMLTATSDSGCQASAILPVVVIPFPTASFVATTGCTQAPVNFLNGSSSASQWLWDFGNAGVTAMVPNPSYTYPSQGTYTVTLIVTSAGGCTDTASQIVNVLASPIPDFYPDTVCVNSPTSFTNTSAAPGGSLISCLWDFGDGSDTSQNSGHTFSVPGIHTVTLSVVSSNGCSGSIVKNVLVFPRPTAAFTYSPPSCIELTNAVEFTDQSYPNIVNWYWNFGDSSGFVSLQNPIHTYKDTGGFVVSLVVQDGNGCLDTSGQSLCVDGWTFYIPNAFTPNGNGSNEYFFGQGIGILEYEMWIFDRWGNMIFHCAEKDLPQCAPCRWDGKVQGDMSNATVQQDVYVWKARLTNLVQDVHSYTGTVTVVK